MFRQTIVERMDLYETLRVSLNKVYEKNSIKFLSILIQFEY